MLSHIKCYNCHDKWRLGTCDCLDCWVPMTSKAVHNAISLVDDRDARTAEVWERFRMSMKDFERRSGGANSELRAIQVRHVHRERTVAHYGGTCGSGAAQAGRWSCSSIQRNALERAAPPSRQSDLYPEPLLNFDVATAEWADPIRGLPEVVQR